MIVCGSSVAFLLGTVMTWRQLALTGEDFYNNLNLQYTIDC